MHITNIKKFIRVVLHRYYASSTHLTSEQYVKIVNNFLYNMCIQGYVKSQDEYYVSMQSPNMTISCVTTDEPNVKHVLTYFFNKNGKVDITEHYTIPIKMKMDDLYEAYRRAMAIV